MLTVIHAPVPAPLDGDALAARRHVQIVVDATGIAQVMVCSYVATDEKPRRLSSGGLARLAKTAAEMIAVNTLMGFALNERSALRRKWSKQSTGARGAYAASAGVQAVSVYNRGEGASAALGVAFANQWWYFDVEPVEDLADADVVVIAITPPARGTQARERYLAALATLEPLYNTPPAIGEG